MKQSSSLVCLADMVEVRFCANPIETFGTDLELNNPYGCGKIMKAYEEVMNNALFFALSENSRHAFEDAWRDSLGIARIYFENESLKIYVPHIALGIYSDLFQFNRIVKEVTGRYVYELLRSGQPQ